MQKELAALIIGYQRLSGVQKIVELCIQNGIKTIYVSIDYPRVSDTLHLSRHGEILQYLQLISLDKRINLSFRVACENVGSAVNVITSCDWFYEKNNYGVILEDDCIPDNSFFDFVRCSLFDIEVNDSIWLISGTQFVPKELIASDRVLLKYPQIWGWATSKVKWNEIRKIYFGAEKDSWPSNIDLSERAFWGAGEDRARRGHLDAWDTILASAMLKKEKYTLASNCNLVTNIGVDNVSTHTKKNSIWIFFPTTHFEIRCSEIKIDYNSSDWLKKKFYGIRVRHQITTKLTRLLDALRAKIAKPQPLLLRLSPDFRYYSNSSEFL